MGKKRSFLRLLDAKPIMKRSRLRVGPLEARGVPAILLGVAAIVAARGLTAALYKGAAILPESLREAREFWLAIRSRQDMLPPTTVAAGP
jgi:hypothetical protein